MLNKAPERGRKSMLVDLANADLWCYDWAHVEVQGIMACKHVATARPSCLAFTKPCGPPCGTAFGQGCVEGAVSVDVGVAAGENDL